MDESEAEDDDGGPEGKQQEQRQWTVDAQINLAMVPWAHALCQCRPGYPGAAVEGADQAESARHSPWQYNRLKAVPEGRKNQGQTCYCRRH